MDYKDLYTGGEQPMKLEEFTRLDDSTRAALFSLVNGIASSENVIISGCVPSFNGSTISITEGYIYIDNEIVKVEAQTVTDGLGTGKFQYSVITTYDADGTKTFVNGIIRQTWRGRRAQLVNVATVTTLSYDGNSIFLSRKASNAEALAGTNDTKYMSPKNTNDAIISNNIFRDVTASESNIAVKTKIVEIGGWNMYATAGGTGTTDLTVDTGVIGKTILALNAVIYNDTATQVLDFTMAGRYYIGMGNSNYNLQIIPSSGVVTIRSDSGVDSVFDKSDFNDDSVNRGYVIVNYID